MLDGVVPRVTQDRDFDTIVRKAYARMLLDRARASRAAAAFDSPPEGLSHEAIKFLKTVYIPAASAGLTEELFELRQLVDGLRRKSQGGGGGGGGGDKMACLPPLERHGRLMHVQELQVSAPGERERQEVHRSVP